MHNMLDYVGYRKTLSQTFPFAVWLLLKCRKLQAVLDFKYVQTVG